jgi:hypothetical protein
MASFISGLDNLSNGVAGDPLNELIEPTRIKFVIMGGEVVKTELPK